MAFSSDADGHPAHILMKSLKRHPGRAGSVGLHRLPGLLARAGHAALCPAVLARLAGSFPDSDSTKPPAHVSGLSIDTLAGRGAMSEPTYPYDQPTPGDTVLHTSDGPYIIRYGEPPIPVGCGATDASELPSTED